MEPNATFYYFKKSDKYYTEDRGVLPDEVWAPYYQGALRARELIMRANGGRMPGLSTTGSNFTCVVLRDNMEKAEVSGWPILLPPVDEDNA